MELIYPRTGPGAFSIPDAPCPTCARRAEYGFGPCAAHSTDVWAGAR